MEAVVVLTIIGIIGYLIHQSLPNTKFKKAQAHFNAKNYAEAINVLNKIFDKHIDAPVKFAECKLNLGQSAKINSEKLKAFNDILALRLRINNSTSVAKFDIIEAKALLEIAKIQYQETKGDIERLNQNIKFIDNANKKGSESDFSYLRTKHFQQLSESYFKSAEKLESTGNLEKAIEEFHKSKEYATKSNNNKIIVSSLKGIIKCGINKDLINATLCFNAAGNDINKINENLKFIEKLSKEYFESEFKNLIAKHYNKLSNLYFNRAKEYEKNYNLLEAIKNYEHSKQYAAKNSNSSIQIFNSIARIEICNLKQLSSQTN